MEVKLIQDSKNVTKIKIAVLGKAVSGKSSLTYRFINYNTPTDHDATIEDKYKTVVDFEGLTCEIEILDTAGQEDYQSMLDTWINFAEGFLLVYAINDKESLERLEKTRDRILKLKKGKVCPIVIVGNKCDLENEREIKEDDAKTIAKQWGALHIETSATENVNCKECFNLLTKQIVKSNINASGDVKTSKKKCCLLC